MSSEVIQLSKYSSRPFQYAKDDTFRLGLTFNYDVDTVAFSLKFYPAGSSTAALTFDDADFTLTGTRKKTLLVAPVDFTLAAGKYRMVLTHTFPDSTVRKRFDSILTVLP